jgi:hypothetical protein
MPHKESRRLGQPATHSGSTWAADFCDSNAVARQLRRRRAASYRCEPLDCSCRDPWTCRCYTTEPPLSEHALDGWRDAALKVLSGGQLPLLPIEVRRALWKRGGPDRVLAERLHDACGGEIT